MELNRRSLIVTGVLATGSLVLPSFIFPSQKTAFIVTRIKNDGPTKYSSFSELFDEKIAQDTQLAYNRLLCELKASGHVTFQGLRKTPDGWESILATPAYKTDSVYQSLEFIREQMKSSEISHTIRITNWVDASFYRKKSKA